MAGAAEVVTDPPATLRAHMIVDLANFVPTGTNVEAVADVLLPRARATLEPAENLMPPGCAPRPFVYFPSLTTWCGQAGLHS